MDWRHWGKGAQRYKVERGKKEKEKRIFSNGRRIIKKSDYFVVKNEFRKLYCPHGSTKNEHMNISKHCFWKFSLLNIMLW